MKDGVFMELLDYIKWRGDLSFDERELNEVDSLIFCALSYETFDDLFMLKKSVTIQEAGKIFFSLYDEEELKRRVTFSNRSYEFLKAMMNTKRYSSLILSDYVNEIDHEIDLQFSAMTIEYPNKWKYIVFRGTDDTITGWKEDFTLIYKDEMLSHKKAIKYIKRVTSEKGLFNRMFSKYDYYIGGHSKGGNLAFYASAHVDVNVLKKIKRIDNFDGPGFSAQFWEKNCHQDLLSKMKTYIPTASFFGRLFEHKEEVIVVSSKQNGLLQHSPYNWLVNVDHFVYDVVSENSNKVINKFNGLLEDIDKKEREELVESLFTIFDKLEIYTFNDFTKISFNSVLVVLKELSELDSKTKKVLLDLLGLVWDIFQ